MKRRTKITLSVIVITLAVIAYFAGPSLIFYVIEKRIIAAIEKLRVDGLEIKYDTLYSQTGNVIFKGMRIKTITEKRNCGNEVMTATIPLLEIEDVHILPILFNRTLELGSLKLDHPDIIFNLTASQNPDKKKEKNKDLETLRINKFIINAASLSFLDSASCDISTKIELTLNVSSLTAKDLHLDSIKWSLSDAIASAIKVVLPKKYYNIKIKEASYSASEKSLSIDSLHVIPDFDNVEFVRKSVYQTDRIHLVVPSLKARGVELASSKQKFFQVKHITMGFWGEVFRDKRYPFKGKENLLPSALIHNAALLFQVDTLALKESFVSYEEFPEGGSQAGKVFFNKLKSTIYNISNVSKNDMVMEASANFMDAGLLNVKFTLPENPNKAYTALGSITNFSMPKINSMLTPAANVEITSGVLDEMKFNFVYNDFRSDGTLVLNYRDLKIVSLKKDKKEQNQLLTFILTLFVKKNIDSHTCIANKTGTILFYRDSQKSIFNYWWKSVLSGIKSVYDLDKISDTSGQNKKR